MAHNTPNPLFGEGPKKPAFPGLASDWSGYMARYREAANPVVSAPRAFFSEVHEFGLLWWTKSLWGRRPSLELARAAGLRAVRRFIEPRVPGAAGAYAAFAARVLSPENPESPYAKRKRLARAVIDASLLAPEQVGPHLDGLLSEDERRDDAEFRRGVQPAVLASFRAETQALLATLSAGRPDFNVAAVLLSGSYAHGSARASSDFDLAVLTRDGTGRDVPELMAALEVRRAALGWPSWTDWERYPAGANVFGVDDAQTPRFVRERPAVVVTLDSALRDRLAAAAAAARPISEPTPLESWYARLAGPFHRWRVRRALARLP
jgi:hypothetical protein